jgi:hypothetical protein
MAAMSQFAGGAAQLCAFNTPAQRRASSSDLQAMALI